MLKKNIALFIDADNASAKKIDYILAELAKYGLVTIRKAYGNWKSPSLKPWEDVLHEYAIQPMQQFGLTKGKNATDIALVIDAMDILHTKPIDIICIVSSDCDFTPLAVRALADGKVVLGFGEHKTPTAFVKSCSKFLYLDDETIESPKALETIIETSIKPKVKAILEAKKTQTNQNPKESNKKLIKLLSQVVDTLKNEKGWASLGPIGNNLAKSNSFNLKKYGFGSLSKLFKSIDSFEVKAIKNTGLWVRDKKALKKSKDKKQ